MNISSSAFQHNEYIPPKYTCEGENVSPPLRFSDVPAGARSLVLIMDDPDAPMGTFTHWTVWNIDPSVREISEGRAPERALEGLTSFGTPGYGGPCPPSGTHRYYFKLYALNTELALSRMASKEQLEQSMEGHVLGSCELIGLYEKKQE